MTETKTYTGGCHCGAVRYQVTTSLANVITCNCSICSKKGALLAFTASDDFRLLSGEQQLTTYLFNKHQIRHLFCAVCGVESFASGTRPDGKPMHAINVRCLDDVDLSSLSLRGFDGKSR